MSPPHLEAELSAKINVIVVNYNGGGYLLSCIDHLSKQTRKNFDLTIIDNGSADTSLDEARKLLSISDLSFEIISMRQNVGFAAANNFAARRSTSDWIAMLNPDAYPNPDWLEKLDQAIQSYPNIEGFGSTQLRAADPSLIDGAGDAVSLLGTPYRTCEGWGIDALPVQSECFSPCAAAALYKKEVFLTCGGFDERFFCYCEDVDLGFRLRLLGYSFIQVRDAIVRHEGSGLVGVGSEFQIYHGNRNRVWMVYKNMPGLVFWPTLPFQAVLECTKLVAYWRAGKIRPYASAMRDAARGLASFHADRSSNRRSRKVSLAKLLRFFPWSLGAVKRRNPPSISANT